MMLCCVMYEILPVQSAVQAKPPLVSRVKEVVLHYFHGFRLLILDVRVAFRLLLKTIQGHTLTRRESKQFRRTVADMFRIVPFSVFIVIPFMELLLPVYLYFLPNALPSTFLTSSAKVCRSLVLCLLSLPGCCAGRQKKEGAES